MSDKSLYDQLWSTAAREWGNRSEWGAAPRSASMISLAWGLPDPATFPATQLTGATELVLREHASTALQYGGMQGQRRLIDVVIKKLKDDEGLAVSPEQVMITAGSSQALSLAARLLINPGDPIVVEAPTFVGAVNMFTRAQAVPHEVPLDAEGMDFERLDRTLSSLQAAGSPARFIYVIPNFQNPTGLTMSFSRRHELLDLAVQHGTLVLEDDAYRDICFSGEVPPSLFAIDSTADISGHVIRTGTFSKILAAGLRLGWVIAPAEVIARMVAFKDDGGTNPFASHVAATFAEAGELARHISELRSHYRQKRDVMIRALHAYCPAEVQWTEPDGGFFVWLTLPERIDTTTLQPRAWEEGVDFVPGARCFASGLGNRHLRLAFSYNTTDEIEEGVKRLGRVLAAAV